MTSAEQDLLQRSALAIEEVSVGSVEALALIGPIPDRPEALDSLTSVQRIAARALLKSVEQLQDLIARTVRVVLILEQEDLAGLTARAIADRAESVGLLRSSDEWSALVRLRNLLAHEYPLARPVQLARLHDAIQARVELVEIGGGVISFARQHGHLGKSA